MTSLETPVGYEIQTADMLRSYCADLEEIAAVLGGGPTDWSIEEVGDGNLNLVFIVKGPKGGIAVKQALPYVRLVGESWPLPLTRAHYEHMALVSQARHAPGLVPAILHYNETLALIIMELLSPHIIMRHGMIAGTVYPKFADDLTTFMANSLYFTSDLALKADQKKAMIADFAGNTALCKITEDLIFTEPYMVAENNRWTAPYLDPFAAKMRDDPQIKTAISQLKIKFMSSAEALIHGDLHTGSVMLTTEDTRVIDPEFAFVGPMGFDVGAVIANLLLNYFSQIGHESQAGSRDAYRDWILETIEQVWTGFRAKFLKNWNTNPTGDGFPVPLFQGDRGGLGLQRAQEIYLDRLFQDSLGFAAAKMIRRILGLAHNIDLENIVDEKVRATAEARALLMAYDLMVTTPSFGSIRAVTLAARGFNRLTPALGQ